MKTRRSLAVVSCAIWALSLLINLFLVRPCDWQAIIMASMLVGLNLDIARNLHKRIRRQLLRELKEAEARSETRGPEQAES